MLLTSHTIASTAIALNIDNPYLIILFSFLAHFPMDALPHFSPRIKSKKWNVIYFASESTFAFLLAIFLSFYFNNWLIFLAFIAIAIPDLLWIPYTLKNWEKPKWFYRFHKKIQWSESPWGIITEIIFIFTVSSFLIF